jgi:tight adherence protein C
VTLATVAEVMAAAAGPAALAAARAATTSRVGQSIVESSSPPADALWTPAVRRATSTRSRSRRARAIDAEVPQLLDLLAVASSAGLSAPLALRRASEAVYGPLADELRLVFGASDLGARWRDELDAMASRTGSPDLRRAVAALSRTETLGASLATSTADLAASVRASRRAATTQRARTAPVKMLFPLVFLILPAFLLLTVVPVLLSTVRSIQ